MGGGGEMGSEGLRIRARRCRVLAYAYCAQLACLCCAGAFLCDVWRVCAAQCLPAGHARNIRGLLPHKTHAQPEKPPRPSCAKAAIHTQAIPAPWEQTHKPRATAQRQTCETCAVHTEPPRGRHDGYVCRFPCATADCAWAPSTHACNVPSKPIPTICQFNSLRSINLTQARLGNAGAGSK